MTKLFVFLARFFDCAPTQYSLYLGRRVPQEHVS